MKKRLIALVLTSVLAVGRICSGITFLGVVSRTIYEESTAHLVENFHQANQALYNLVLFYLQGWGRSLAGWTERESGISHPSDAPGRALCTCGCCTYP